VYRRAMRRFIALAALTLGCAAPTAPCERVHREPYERTAMLNRTELIIVVDPGSRPMSAPRSERS